MSLNERQDPTLAFSIDKSRKDLPTEAELESKPLEELITYRAKFEEKLAYMRDNNSADNKMLQDNEGYHLILERVIKNKVATGAVEDGTADKKE